eukprot:GFUD01017206.1.p1 GENE.GFUD01017206.1~~GFUD01017206.1.p1  ORF type:complete len:476 (-),score=199.32 GFUD01017206.1:136-1563(-)
MENLENPDVADDDVLDYTDQVYTEDKSHKIRISNGISLRDLNSDGIVFHPEIEEEAGREEGSRNYFSNHLEEIEKLLAERQVEDEEEDLAENENLSEFEAAMRKMKDISGGDGGVMKRVVLDGLQTPGSVPADSTITIHYSLQLEGQDEPFDSSVLRGRPERYKLGDGQLIEGLEVGVRTMKKGEKAQFLIDWMYAYGQYGCPPRIPPRTACMALVELLDFVEEGQAEALLAMGVEDRNKKHNYPDTEKVVRIEHNNGNNYVRKEEWKMALRHYDRGIKLLQEVSLANREEEERRQRILLKLQLNTAHCCLKVKWPKKACIACREALDIEKENTKALFRFGKAKRMLEDYDSAKELLTKAQRRAPQDMSIAEELRSLEDQLSREKNNEKALCMNMFKTAGDVKRDQVEGEFYSTMLQELELFQEQPENEMSFPAQFSVVEMKAVRAAANKLEMEVRMEEDHRGNKKVRVIKSVRE